MLVGDMLLNFAAGMVDFFGGAVIVGTVGMNKALLEVLSCSCRQNTIFQEN